MDKKTLASYSWSMILRGVIAILFGVLALFWPSLTLEILIFIFAFYALIDGFIAIFISISSAKKHTQWGIFLFEGIIGLLIGIIALVWPGITMVILLYIIAVWAILTGLLELFGAIAIPWEAATRWLLGFGGVLSLILGVLMFVFPITSLFVIVILLGIYALVFGILMIVFGIKLRASSK